MRQSKDLLEAIYDKLYADTTLQGYVKKWYKGPYGAVSQFPFVSIWETSGPSIDPQTIGATGHDEYLYNYTVEAAIKNLAGDIAYWGNDSTPGIMDLKDDLISVLWCNRVDRKFSKPLRVANCTIGMGESNGNYIYAVSIELEGTVRVQRTSCE